MLIDRLFVDWDELETPEEYEIMKRYAENSRRYSLGYSLYCFSSVCLFMCISLIPQLLDVVLPLNESRPILSTYPGYYFVDEKKYFFYIFSHAIVAWEIAMAGIVTHDCMLLTYIEHVCSIFAIVGFAELIEDTFSLTLAIQLALNTVMISITLLQMKVLIDQLFIEWDDLQTPEELEIMKKYAEKGRRYSLGYSLYCFISVYLFMSLSLVPQLLDVILPLNESRPILPAHPGYYFVDEKKYFYYIFSHAIVAWEVAMTGIVAHDCMLLTYVEHVCSIFAITGFAQLIEDTFSLTLAIQIMLNTVMISITLLQVTQEDADVLVILKYVVYVIAQLIHLFCLSFEGQKLIDHSLQTRDTIYNSPWYKTPAKSQKMLLFVMRKSLQPMFLTAGKIYIFSLENFTSVKLYVINFTRLERNNLVRQL
ncbi:hypothetical protein EAG_15050 [Camponotus floridanus]|uniref:Odorant receptor n=1 Tax=Camponotus floridanus TaxID=104421 RepID=E2AZU5_CAMFO|nr:hypothetical protein EAG_15050 [Camponotus floridanus]